MNHQNTIAKEAYVIFGHIVSVATVLIFTAVYFAPVGMENLPLGHAYAPAFMGAFAFSWNVAISNKYMAKDGKRTPAYTFPLALVCAAVSVITIVLIKNNSIESIVAIVAVITVMHFTKMHVSRYVNKYFKPEWESKNRPNNCDCDDH